MKNLVIILSLLFFPLISFCQLDETFRLSGKSWQELKAPIQPNQLGSLLFLSFRTFDVNRNIPIPAETSILCTKYKGKAPTAFFCRMEDKLEHKVKFPIRMRLGTLDYVDRLEQKHINYE